MGEGYGEEGASTNGGESTCMGNSTAAGDCNINSEDLKVDVKDLINIGNFEKARRVKPVNGQEEPGYVVLMPYCQVACVVATILAVVFVVLGYQAKSEKKSESFKYVGFAMIFIAVGSFIAVIYINSVSNTNLIDTMRKFRRSKAANPQIAKQLARKASDASSSEA